MFLEFQLNAYPRAEILTPNSTIALSRVQASIEKVGQAKFFPPEHVFSAATSLEVPTTKPDPAIYLHACKVIGKDPGECVAVEDSKSGALSGYVFSELFLPLQTVPTQRLPESGNTDHAFYYSLRAGIPVMGYVGSYEGKMKQQEMNALFKELGVKVIMEDWADFDKCLAEIEAM